MDDELFLCNRKLFMFFIQFFQIFLNNSDYINLSNHILIIGVTTSDNFVMVNSIATGEIATQDYAL